MEERTKPIVNDKYRSKSGSFDRTIAPCSAPKSGPRRSNGNLYGYQYHSVDLQLQNVEFTYSCGSSFIFGDSSHRGLGCSDELRGTPSNVEASSKQMEEQEESCDEDEYGEIMYKQSSHSFEEAGTVGSSESDHPEEPEDTSDGNLDVDEEGAKDYIEGIGGSDKIMKAKWLIEEDFGESDDDTSSSLGYDETLGKMGGIVLQEASREYGMKKAHPRQKHKNPYSMISAAGDRYEFILLSILWRVHIKHLPTQYDELFPAQCDAHPDIFPPELYSWESFLWACEFCSKLTWRILDDLINMFGSLMDELGDPDDDERKDTGWDVKLAIEFKDLQRRIYSVITSCYWGLKLVEKEWCKCMAEDSLG
ncbi:hypothetical protein FNV43_RR03229 [Rhamnella rubrinervis]|uniref:Uncharacterized protein n=1 Tax=Rhamnella rubrinervis TaxID=2594499 RepID=A0A8K0MNH8_9ROSA|nr:hypothetical protein FNV43_RR03229 [Rhamnella rubrinervis]